MGDAGATALAVGVKMSGALETLNLDREWPNVLIHTPHGWACCSRVRTAASADNEIGDAGATALAEGVKGSETLTTLDLAGEFSMRAPRMCPVTGAAAVGGCSQPDRQRWCRRAIRVRKGEQDTHDADPS